MAVTPTTNVSRPTSPHAGGSDSSGEAKHSSAWLRPASSASLLSLFTSGGTLICCALPALLVALGAGAALAGLVSAVPALVWLSERSAWVFAGAGLMLVLAGWLQWRARFEPCPTDPALAATCMRTRRVSAWVYGVSVLIYLVGAFFAFVAPLLFF